MGKRFEMDLDLLPCGATKQHMVELLEYFINAPEWIKKADLFKGIREIDEEEAELQQIDQTEQQITPT